MPESKQLDLPFLLWGRLILHLRTAGQNRRESGAFLLVRPTTHRVVKFIPYETIDPFVMQTGIIRMRAHTMVKLWQICERKGLRVAADIHTHPGSNTSQSDLDMDHPMIPSIGHLALIVPNYAQGNLTHQRGVGIYQYLGDGRWLNQSRKQSASHVV